MTEADCENASTFLLLMGLTEHTDSPVTFLCGAGISYPPPTSLPTVRAFIDRSCRHCTDDTEVHEGLGRVVHGGLGVPPRFEVLVNAISQIGVKAASIGALFDSVSSNKLHRFLGMQCRAGAAVVTTNFDNCIERTIVEPYSRVVFRGVDLTIEVPQTSVIVKPHGSNPLDSSEEVSELVVSIRTLARTAKGFARFPVWRAYLKSLMQGRTVIVVGYSGSDDFDITPVLLESEPAHMVWMDYASDEAPRKSDLASASMSVQRICTSLPSTYMRGNFGMVAARVLGDATPVVTPSEQGPLPTLDQWLDMEFSSAAGKQALLCAILRHYSLHDLTVKHTETPLSSEAALERGAALYYLGKYAECREVLEHIAWYSPTPIQRCQASYLTSSACFYLGDTTAAKTESQHQVALAEQLQDLGELQTALNHAAALAYSLGELDEARAHYQRVLDYQDAYPSLQAATMAAWGLADIANVSGDGRAAMEGYTAARDLCVQLGSSQGVAWMSANLGELLLRMRECDESAKHLEEAEELFTEQGVAAGLLHTMACRARLQYCIGNLITARDTLRHYMHLLPTHLDSPALSTVVALSYLLASDLNDPGFLYEIRTAAAGVALKAMDVARTGQVEHGWALCRRVLHAEVADEQVYEDCRQLIVGD